MTRTTLDLDPRVLAAARARARAHGTTLGHEVSVLAEAGLAGQPVDSLPGGSPRLRGLVLAPRVPGHVITNEMVADADDE